MPELPFWRKVFSGAPRQLKWDLKMPEDFTAKRFPKQPRYGPRAGHENPTFLDANAFQGAFLEPLAPYLDRVEAIQVIEKCLRLGVARFRERAKLDEEDAHPIEIGRQRF